MNDEKTDMSLPECVAELQRDVAQLARAHSILLGGMRVLSSQLEVAQHNCEILQNAILSKATAIPVLQSVN